MGMTDFNKINSKFDIKRNHVYGRDAYFNASILSDSEVDKVWYSDSDLSAILNQWISNVGANDSRVEVDLNSKNKAERLKKSVYNFFYQDLIWEDIENRIVKLVCKEGQAFIMVDKSGVKVYSKSMFRVKSGTYNPVLQSCYWEMVVDGAIVLTDLVERKDFFVIRDPIFSDCIITPTRIDLLYNWLLLENHSIIANDSQARSDWIGSTLISLKNEMYQVMENKKDPVTKKNGIQLWLEAISDKVSGVRKAYSPSVLPEIHSLHQLSRTTKDMEFLGTIDKAIEKKAIAFSLTPADLGVGGNSTYNNTKTFDLALFDKVGRPLQKQLDLLRNTFILKAYGFGFEVKIYYNEPPNPDKQKEEDSTTKLYAAKIITLNEARERLGFEVITGGDEIIQALPNKPQETKEEKKEPEKIENALKVDFKDIKTPTEKALESDDFLGSGKKKGFLKRWDKAINNQLNDYVERIKKTDLKELEAGNFPEIQKIESFYSFNTLKKDLLIFADKGLEQWGRNLAKFKAEFKWGEYPDYILDMVDDRILFLFKGEGTYKGIDAETSSQIATIIKEFINEGVEEIAKQIIERIPDIALNRAKTIASTEVANIVEGASFEANSRTFIDGKKKWITCQDEFVREDHRKNEKEGEINIDKPFKNGNMRAGQDINCRCTIEYIPGKTIKI